ncbi:MAG: hypothetical protein LBD25_03070, partial [Coriobacteriales bacterium]|nr:hypothetical protein [Coriobacteriales bacterium]
GQSRYVVVATLLLVAAAAAAVLVATLLALPTAGSSDTASKYARPQVVSSSSWSEQSGSATVPTLDQTEQAGSLLYQVSSTWEKADTSQDGYTETLYHLSKSAPAVLLVHDEDFGVETEGMTQADYDVFFEAFLDGLEATEITLSELSANTRLDGLHAYVAEAVLGGQDQGGTETSRVRLLLVLDGSKATYIMLAAPSRDFDYLVELADVVFASVRPA